MRFEEGTSYQKLPFSYSGVAQKLCLAMQVIVLHSAHCSEGNQGEPDGEQD